MKLFNFIKKYSSKLPYFNILTIAIAIVVAGSSVWTHWSKDRQELSFIVESTKKVVDLEKGDMTGDLSLTYGGEEIKELYLLEAKIKNTGNKAIQLEDLYDQEIAFSAQDMTTKFIHMSSEQVPYYRGCSFSQYPYQLYLKPDLLNPGDYLELFIFFTQEGDIKLPVFETSIINGVTRTIDNRSN